MEEKTKRERYAPVRIMKYTEIDQSAKTEMKEVTLKMREACAGERRERSRHESARPPSNPRAGRRFIKAKTMDAAVNNSVSNGSEIAVANRAVNMFASGPERVRIDSFT